MISYSTFKHIQNLSYFHKKPLLPCTSRVTLPQRRTPMWLTQSHGQISKQKFWTQPNKQLGRSLIWGFLNDNLWAVDYLKNQNTRKLWKNCETNPKCKLSCAQQSWWTFSPGKRNNIRRWLHGPKCSHQRPAILNLHLLYSQKLFLCQESHTRIGLISMIHAFNVANLPSAPQLRQAWLEARTRV